MSKKIYSIDEARALAKRRLPRMMFDFIDGAAGNEQAKARNRSALEAIHLQPRVLVNVDQRNLKTTLLGREWGLPFGIAPMGMCELAWPGTDKMLAQAAVEHNIPLGLSTAGSSSIEDIYSQAGDNTWFQLYVGGSEEQAMGLVERAKTAGYSTLIFTVDVPQVAPRLRDLRNGFGVPFKIGPKQFFDFAIHPRWSLTTLFGGAPKLANFPETGNETFKRNEGRGKVDWAFLDRLRAKWKGNLIVKGVTSADDAARIQAAGADAIYVSNHGGRQLDSAPAAIHILPKIRTAVGPDYPLVFDSGIRSGESIIKALALGADFVMLGRPFLYGTAADGQRGLNDVINLLSNEISVTMAQIGRTDVNEIDVSVLSDQ
ncbi:MAG: isopentenyl diphosphate isomerase/L-lactate dehydrogenase-like FMN-dependent dehydrogenase [Cellvibrionaceae bacterium]|jgi:isopentenyl diphosphate isomerase/L-lactate dehydrogenase-like FMN-dependent dehydrogenase